MYVYFREIQANSGSYSEEDKCRGRCGSLLPDLCGLLYPYCVSAGNEKEDRAGLGGVKRFAKKSWKGSEAMAWQCGEF